MTATAQSPKREVIKYGMIDTVVRVLPEHYQHTAESRSGGRLTQDDISQIVDALEQLDWVQGVKADLAAKRGNNSSIPSADAPPRQDYGAAGDGDEMDDEEFEEYARQRRERRERRQALYGADDEAREEDEEPERFVAPAVAMGARAVAAGVGSYLGSRASSREQNAAEDNRLKMARQRSRDALTRMQKYSRELEGNSIRERAAGISSDLTPSPVKRKILAEMKKSEDEYKKASKELSDKARQLAEMRGCSYEQAYFELWGWMPGDRPLLTSQ